MLTLALWAITLFIAFAHSTAHAACAPPTGGGVAICSPQPASNDVNPVHYIAAAFPSEIEPTDSRVIAAIEKELARVG